MINDLVAIKTNFCFAKNVTNDLVEIKTEINHSNKAVTDYQNSYPYRRPKPVLVVMMDDKEHQTRDDKYPQKPPDPI